jgi:threonine aldolase
MTDLVDLRSDTVTRPTAAMREAMAAAEVGDDVLGDDPTGCRLETLAASLVGKAAALFVPSGTMGNQLAILAQTRRGQEVICGRSSHVLEHEVGAAAVISAVTLVPVPDRGGRIAPEDVTAAIRTPDLHHPETGLLCLESAHSGGAVAPLPALEAAATVARAAGLAVHLDGARLFNAAAALGVPAARIAAVADTVMFCVSKGLGAPVGSLLCGPADLVARARKGRKLLGGGMRQVGILAAAGLHALAHHVDRLAEDHRRAGRLAEGLARLPGVVIDVDCRDINMIWFTLDHPAPPDSLVEGLARRGVQVLPPMHGRWRLVTHLDVDDAGLDRALAAFREVLAA